MQAVWLAIGVIIGAAIVLVALRPRLRSLSVDAARAAELDRALDRAQGELGHERELAQERLSALTDAQARMSDSFKALSAEALRSNSRQLAELAQVQLRAAQTEAKGDLDQRRDQVEQLVAPLKEQLGRVDSQLTRLDHERRASQVRLESELRNLTESGERLRVQTGALVTALRKPNTRGQWGQMQLRNVVEAAGMLRHCDFSEQVSYTGEEAMLRPDMIVRLPGGKTVVVDAKAPLQGLLDAYEAGDEAEREEHLRAHARLLRRHVKQLGDKAYWSRLDSTPDMVVMFLPGESLIGPALDADPELLGDAMSQRVLIATPTTLLALLHAVAYGWQQERVAESAQAISELGRELHSRLVRLSSTLGSLGKRLNGAVSAYNETIGSYEARVLPSARRFADHGAVAEGTEIPALEPVASTARTVQPAAELRLDVGTGRAGDQVGDGQVGDRQVDDRDPLPPRRLRSAG